MQEDKQEHFIKNIKIKNFKCFEDFQAEGFGRVNLISGKNNVGKTAFMEACFLGKSKSIFELYHGLLTIKSQREGLNRLAYPKSSEEYLFDLTKQTFFNIESNFGRVEISPINNNFKIYTINSNCEEKTFSDLSNQLQSYFGNNSQYATQSSFISAYFVLNETLNVLIDQLKIENKYELLTTYISKLFDIEKIDIIQGKPYIRKNGLFRPLSDYGIGMKSFINMILPLLFAKENNIIFIDELENGIHYTNLDKLWEIILTISKEQNVQVFATTHSKECIESYARVAKKLEDEEIRMIVLARNLKNELKALVYDDKMFYSELEQNHEVRGW